MFDNFPLWPDRASTTAGNVDALYIFLLILSALMTGLIFVAVVYFAARYRRVMQHRGHKKAVVAVAHALLVTAYHLLAHHTTYHNPGADYYDRATPSGLGAALSKPSNARATSAAPRLSSMTR